ncbi:MAG TPA: glycosyltransferase family 4 protein [Anaerolineaceae bacterium]|nr:glycosyltransferase family 4 protein [Anaerolineaceae bacterium]
MQKVKIGVLAYRMDFYTNLRIILNQLPEAEYVPVRDIFSYRRALALKLNQVIGKPLFPTFDLNNQFEDFDLNRVDVLHFSNGVSYGKTPWVSHFETILPRFSELLNVAKDQQWQNLQPGRLTLKGLEALRSSSCKQIIAWSENAANIQRKLLSEISSEFCEPILAKLCVLHPAQDVLVGHVPSREYDQEHPIRFILVGAGFFRKGGRELFRTFQKLAGEEGFPIRLVVVSSLRLEPYAAQETEEDLNWARQIIASKPKWLEYYEELPNSEVLDLLKNADVGLLPTWADTYGLSVLEAQACGCPVITTDVRALPEINNNRVGWLIRVPKDELGEAFYGTGEDRQRLSQEIQNGLESIIRSIVAEPAMIALKGQAALERIRTEHNPHDYAERLRQIYLDAVA